MPVSDIRQARSTRTADRKLDLEDAKAVIAAAGKSVSDSELEEIAKTLVARGQYEVAPDAQRLIQGQVRTLQQLRNEAEAQNRMVDRRGVTLQSEETAILKEGVTTKTYGGSVVPEAVKKVLNEMRKNGAAAFDVAELEKNPEKDEHDPTQWTLTGK